MTGELGILNVGAGDTKLSFDPAKPAERKRAAKIVTDMLRRGFAILVQVGEKDGKPLYQRAEAFDENTCEYLIVGDPPEPRRTRTVALSLKGETTRILAALCLHPIAYYEGSWAGAMCPTDDVIAHLMLMRGDEAMFWRRANQHPPYRPEAGI